MNEHDEAALRGRVNDLLTRGHIHAAGATTAGLAVIERQLTDLFGAEPKHPRTMAKDEYTQALSGWLRTLKKQIP